MTAIYGIIGVILSSIFIRNCYERIVMIQFSKIQHVLFSVLYFVFAYTVVAITPIFLRPLLVIGFVSGMALLMKKSVNLLVMAWSFLIAQVVWLTTALLVGTALLEILGTTLTVIAYSLSLILEIGTYVLILRSKLLEDVVLIVNERHIKKLAYILGLLLLYGITYLRFFLSYLHHLHDITLFFILLIFIVFISIVFVLVLDGTIKKYHEKQADQAVILEKEKEIVDLQKEWFESKERVVDMKVQLDEMTVRLDRMPIDSYHKFKKDLRISNDNFKMLQRSLATLEETGSLEDVSELNELARNLKSSLGELGDKLDLEEVDQLIEGLELPSAWWELRSLLSSYLWEAKEKGVDMFLDNTSSLWEGLEVSESLVNQLLENLISNGVKELMKSEDSNKILSVRFFDKDECFGLSVQDNAHEFSVEVFQRLGKRGNSTNGTGDGYPEVFEILEECGGSLFIEEILYMEKMMKTIKIIFDGCSKKVVKSNYRTDLLRFELVESVLDVEI